MKQDHEKLFRRLAYLEKLAKLAEQLEQKQEVKKRCLDPCASCYIYWSRRG